MSEVRGLAEAYALLGAVPEAAREELGVELAIIGREGLAIQQAAAPVRTGALRAGLSLQLLIDRLTVRIGLIGLKGKRSRLFYGRVVNFGRRGETVLVTRRVKKRRPLKAGGKLRRRGPNRGTPVGSPYRMKVPARAGVDFINAPGRAFEEEAVQQLAEYWSRVLARAGAAA